MLVARNNDWDGPAPSHLARDEKNCRKQLRIARRSVTVDLANWNCEPNCAQLKILKLKYNIFNTALDVLDGAKDLKQLHNAVEKRHEFDASVLDLMMFDEEDPNLCWFGKCDEDTVNFAEHPSEAVRRHGECMKQHKEDADSLVDHIQYLLNARPTPSARRERLKLGASVYLNRETND